ncbi:hypothetical protein EYF80_033732 [Liparis tanakae]|uniref:Uncharacterized protein n=1 Tax=Liparis tanakae TaxID=230148 RepID=A0A4Z2GRB9_9TELE|nr:hypothetical protein EYF80_033732 [Liparis tanakae]
MALLACAVAPQLIHARIIMQMTPVEGAYGRNGDTADANRAEGGGKTRDRGDVTELRQAEQVEGGSQE